MLSTSAYLGGSTHLKHDILVTSWLKTFPIFEVKGKDAKDTSWNHHPSPVNLYASLQGHPDTILYTQPVHLHSSTLTSRNGPFIKWFGQPWKKTTTYSYLVGGFSPTHLKNMKKSNWVHLPQFSGWKFQKYRKPPTRNMLTTIIICQTLRSLFTMWLFFFNVSFTILPT